jgi:hypothetical protein
MPGGAERSETGGPRRGRSAAGAAGRPGSEAPRAEKPGPDPPRRERSADDDPLKALEERIERASRAAERLFSEAAAEAVRRVKPPPAGWQVPDAAPPGEAEPDPVLALLDTIRELVPADLRRRLAEAIRELLLALRALIDWYLERVDRQPDEPPEVQDIPIA